MLPGVHRFTDHAFASMPLGDPLYADGFGDPAALEELVRAVRAGTPQLPIDGLEMHWLGPTSQEKHIHCRQGTFVSPAATYLPPESRSGVVELLLPATSSESARPPICVMLAATAEVGFARRRRLVTPLVAAGIGALLLENPYYGPRRPAQQRGTALRTVRDQFAMNLATVYEAAALLHWLDRQGYARLATTGYSQGGFMAAFAAAVTSLPVAAVPIASGSAAQPIFTAGALSRILDWKKLAAEAGSREAAHARLSELLREVDLKRVPPPLRVDAAILVAARYDEFVAPAEVEALHAHWPGSELRWQSGGHVTQALFGQAAQRQAIRDALERLSGQQASARQMA